ncbi:hypothetical protein Q9L58_004918 [Maublancomyces gigas]|uniref:Uncharacterized protein n=1 Tax=Discina gigas TaxID=1032678 RepID=A0ABR3GJM1_9PEZI
MQYSFNILFALLPALVTAQSFANSTTSAPSTEITSFPTLIPTHSFPNGTNSITKPVSTRGNVTRTVTGSDGVVSTATSIVIVSPTDDPAASSPALSATNSAGLAPNSANGVGNSAGAFAIGMIVLLVGRLL